MWRAMALITFFFNRLVGSLFNSLVTDGKNHAAQDTSTRMVRLYVRDLINNLSFLSYHFREKKITSDCKPLTTAN